MLHDSRKLQSQAVCQSELGGRQGPEHPNKDSGVENSNELGLSTNNIRRSSRLQSRKKVTSSSLDNFKSEENGFKCKMESSKSSYDVKNFPFRGKLGVGYVPKVPHKNDDDGAFSARTTVASSPKSTKSVPSFEFHVRSEKGINLVVDLNSSPSDWSKRIENEVCLCRKFRKTNFQCFRQELEYLGNSNNLVRSSLIKNTSSDCGAEGHIKIVPSQNSIHKENGHVRFDQPDGSDGSLRFSVTKPESAAIQIAVTSEEEKEVPLLSASIISSTECCPRDGEMGTVDSAVHDPPGPPLVKDSSFVNLRKEGSESSHTMKAQNIKFNSTQPFLQLLGEEHRFKVSNGTCGSTALQDTFTLESPIAENPGSATIGAKEIQLPSKVACHLKDSLYPENICSPNLVDTINTAETENGCSSSINEFDHSTCRNLTSGEWEMGNAISDQSETRKELVASSTHKRKSHYLKSDYAFGQHTGRILRSTKHFHGQILRRSPRLVSK